MAGVWRRKDRDVWIADFRDATGRRVRLTARTREEAEEQLAEQIKASRQPAPVVADRHITLAEYAARWTETLKQQIEPKTIRSYAQLLRLHILPHLGHYKIRDLHLGHVKAFLQEKGRADYQKNTVRLMKATLSALLTEAVEDMIIQTNPVLQLGRSRGKKRPGQLTQADQTQKIHPLSWEDLRAFTVEATSMERAGLLPLKYPVLFALLIKTGLRPGEAYALQPGDLNLAGRTLRVERALSDDGRIKSTKTYETRVVDLSAELTEHLRAYLTRCELEQMAAGGTESPWLFPQ